MKVIVTFLVMALFSCGGGGVRDQVGDLTGSTVTPGGVSVRSDSPVSAATKAAIDRGIAATIEKARCKGYTKALTLSSYKVAIIKGEIYKGVPVYRIPCGSHCAEYGQGDGTMFVAGQFLEPDTVVFPEQENPEQIAGFEAEHLVLFQNDKAEFERTHTHGSGSGHPILSECR